MCMAIGAGRVIRSQDFHGRVTGLLQFMQGDMPLSHRVLWERGKEMLEGLDIYDVGHSGW